MSAGKFEQRIDKRSLPVVYMRYYRDIPYIFSSFLVWHYFFAFLILILGGLNLRKIYKTK